MGGAGTFPLPVKSSLCEMCGKVQKEISGPENHESCTGNGEIPVWQHCLSAGHPGQALDILSGTGGCGTNVKVKPCPVQYHISRLAG